ncbi:MAG: type III-B CRISPR module RAMP protein Cmr6 [Bacteroidales bacterium]|jgi:CRISPR-associated protein Cmr6|nr:type III-B CRISPR module RAMP protein Cmr6 [Bacteroidales bacterium]
MEWKNMDTPNLGLLVYKKLYTEEAIKSLIKYQPALSARSDEKERLYIDIAKDAKTTPFDPFYKAVFDQKLESTYKIINPVATHHILLQTTYPGLLIGSGYTHDSNAKGDLKIGFYFDHTTGQPVIPGSSVKGVFKSVFENEDYKTDEKSLRTIRFIIDEIINKEDGDTELKEEWTNIKVSFSVEILKHLKDTLFGTQNDEGVDIFFDAVINIAQTGEKKYIGSDFITPHEHPLKNPNPLMLLKVLPGVVFEFRFKLKDYSNGTFKLTANQKLKLFRQILLTIGIGAKTNVGYGQFDPV